MDNYDQLIIQFNKLKLYPYDKTKEIYQIGKRLISLYSSKLDSCIYDVMEKTAISSLHEKDLKFSQEKVGILFNKFPKSNRVLILMGMCLEFQKRWDDAITIYNTILRDDPLFKRAIARIVAVKISQNLYDEAIIELNKYLEIYPLDQYAWIELTELYIKINKLEKALFCIEELILLNPYNQIYQEKCAWVNSQFPEDSMKVNALNHYYISLRLDPCRYSSLDALIDFISKNTFSKVHKTKVYEIKDSLLSLYQNPKDLRNTPEFADRIDKLKKNLNLL